MADRVIGNYQVIEKIGAGGMGEVYRALDTRLSREVALKILPEEVSQNADTLARFEREAKAVAALSHPNILAIHEFGTDDGVAYAATELLEGETLRDRLQRGHIPLRKAVEMAGQIADGLAAAHAQGIVHRDLKPENVFVLKDGRIKILDFGLARVEPLQHGSQAATFQVDTAPGTIMGTMGYMSPEQVRGERVDGRSDIFAFGALLHEMLSGERAFPGDTPADILGSILRDDPPEVNQSNPSLPEAVGRVVQHCLEKNPEERFQSARDLGFALKASSSSSHPSLSSLDVPAAPRRRRLALIPVLAVLGWAAAVWLWTQRGPGSSEGGNGEPVSTLPWTFTGHDHSPSASPDGNNVAFVSERNGVAQIWIKQVRGGSERPITSGPDVQPRFSPDGSQILFLRRSEGQSDLYRVPVQGGNVRKLLERAQDADWSPSGDEIVFLRSTFEPEFFTEVRLHEVRSGTERVLATIPERFLYGPRWSPDGTTIALSESHMSGNAINSKALRFIDVASGEGRLIIPDALSSAFTATEWLADGTVLVAQHASLLSSVGNPLSRMLRWDPRTEESTMLFWAFTNVPLGGISYSTLAPVGQGRLVFEGYRTRQNLVRVDLAAPDQPRELLSGIARDRQPHVSPDNSLLLFSSERAGNLDLWVQNLNTGELQQFTDDEADDWDPAWSPDGQHIVWSSSRSGNLEIWIMNADGSGARQVTRNGVNAENPTMTGDGQWIVYTNTDPQRSGLYRVRPDGSEDERFHEGICVTPDVHPSQPWVMYLETRYEHVLAHMVHVETGESHVAARIESPAAMFANVLLGRGRWWPDGRSFIFIGPDEAGRTGIFRQDWVPGENSDATRRALTGFATESDIESLAITPDGRSLILSILFEEHSLQMADGVPFIP